MIPDDKTNEYLRVLLDTEPGTDLHTAIVVTASCEDLNALGVPDPDKLHVVVLGIAPDGNVDPEEYTSKAIIAASMEALESNRIVYFAGIGMEVYGVARNNDEVTENLARRLKADGKLREHPAAVEMTLLYAASRDGRRWMGSRLHTGPNAGTVNGPVVHTGPLRCESGIIPHVIRAVAGAEA